MEVVEEAAVKVKVKVEHLVREVEIGFHALGVVEVEMQFVIRDLKVEALSTQVSVGAERVHFVSVTKMEEAKLPN